jgi:hypothetical protein
MSGMSVGLLAVVVLVIVAGTAMFWPLRAVRTPRARRHADDVALEISREAKLGELHDLELDFRLGKLSMEDYRALSATVRAEAIEVIREIDASSRNGNAARTRRRPR